MSNFNNTNLKDTRRYWLHLARMVRGKYAPHDRLILKLPCLLFHPKYISSFVRDAGMPAGAKGDWRMRFTDGSGLHVQENYDGTLSVYWDRVDPTPNVFARLRHGAQDAPGTFMVLSTAICAFAGYFIGGKKGAWVGTGIGLNLGAVGLHTLR